MYIAIRQYTKSNLLKLQFFFLNMYILIYLSIDFHIFLDVSRY